MWVTYKRIGGSLSSERSNHYISNPKSENANWILEIRQSNLRFPNLGSQTQDSSNFEIFLPEPKRRQIRSAQGNENIHFPFRRLIVLGMLRAFGPNLISDK